ncbi:hypothetical protein [Catenovulum maritimum]|uniref:DUF2946 domain-containing protein n=1 Tax=Catenovulum maritimum TaxID=1513271 RepID=A0A0J8GVE2_9ALTE|nr:hypothetical protein [Catenovulum maritimum]KMT66755.1 hypothetical protein XM47_01115 [Catenovulum maritimum]
MNINRFSKYIMIVLILLQSLSAVAKSVDFHMLDPEHLQTTHVHALDDNQSSYEIAEDGLHNPADCHHCGHCNGSHVQGAPHAYLHQLFVFKHTHSFIYQNSVIESPSSKLLRPPKK